MIPEIAEVIPSCTRCCADTSSAKFTSTKACTCLQAPDQLMHQQVQPCQQTISSYTFGREHNSGHATKETIYLKADHDSPLCMTDHYAHQPDGGLRPYAYLELFDWASTSTSCGKLFSSVLSTSQHVKRQVFAGICFQFMSHADIYMDMESSRLVC